jgi:hypothetical protein
MPSSIGTAVVLLPWMATVSAPAWVETPRGRTVTGHDQVLIPVSYEFTLTNLATGGIETASFRKESANRLPTTTCTFRETFTEGGVTFEFSGVVEAMIRPPG